MIFTVAVVRVMRAVRGAAVRAHARALARALVRARVCVRAWGPAPVGAVPRGAVRVVLRAAVAAVVLAAVAAAGAAAGTPVGGAGSGARAPAAPEPAWAPEFGTPAGARSPGCAGGTGAAARCWPVTGPGARGRPELLRLFDPPPQPWAAGHRGVDLRAGPGAPVRAPAPGVVVFAGAVGGVPVLVLRLAGGLRVTYEPVRASVPLGARVAAGARVGTLDGFVSHCPGPCLHWGLLSGTVYLDPLSLLPAALRHSGPSRLLPLADG